MSTELDPETTDRALSFRYFIDSPQPTVTVFKTLDVTRAVRYSKRTGRKLNMVLCHCIGAAASEVPEFYTIPDPKKRKLIRYERIGVNVVVNDSKGGISNCDIPYDADMDVFERSYLETTRRASEECRILDVEDLAIVGTSAMVRYDLDGIVNMYSGVFFNPFMAWPRYRKKWFRCELKVSFQFHHVQMDGEQACRFLDLLQAKLDAL